EAIVLRDGRAKARRDADRGKGRREPTARPVMISPHSVLHSLFVSTSTLCVACRPVRGARRLRPPARIAVAAATRRTHDETVCRIDLMRALAGKRAAAAQKKLSGRTGMPARTAPRGMRDAVECGEQRERRAVKRADLHLLPEAATRGALAARTLAQLAPPE